MKKKWLLSSVLLYPFSLFSYGFEVGPVVFRPHVYLSGIGQPCQGQMHSFGFGTVVQTTPECAQLLSRKISNNETIYLHGYVDPGTITLKPWDKSKHYVTGKGYSSFRADGLPSHLTSVAPESQVTDKPYAYYQQPKNYGLLYSLVASYLNLPLVSDIDVELAMAPVTLDKGHKPGDVITHFHIENDDALPPGSIVKVNVWSNKEYAIQHQHRCMVTRIDRVCVTGYGRWALKQP